MRFLYLTAGRQFIVTLNNKFIKNVSFGLAYIYELAVIFATHLNCIPYFIPLFIMTRIAFLNLLVTLFSFSTAYSQSSNRSVSEIDFVRDSVLKLHQNDEFYFYVRFLPSVRVSIDEFVLSKKADKFIAKYYRTTFKPPPWEGTNRTKRERELKISEFKDSSLTSFINLLDVPRLVNYTNSDSLTLDNSKLLTGTFGYFIIICSNGIVKLIEYPVTVHRDTNEDLKTKYTYWQSNYLDKVISIIKQSFRK